METIVYMVRHAESPFTLGNERVRGLSEKGERDADKVLSILRTEKIDALFSSPYRRAVQTLELLKNFLGIDIILFEDLKEKSFQGTESIRPGNDFILFIKKSFSNPDFCLPGGETNNQAQRRAVAVFDKLLGDYEGKKIAIGTHGNIMVLMMNYYDQKYDFEFFQKTSKPDIYKMIFEEKRLKSVERLWNEEIV